MAVYTDVREADLSGFLSRYAIGRVLSYKGIAEGVENSNYLLRTETGSYILTLYERRVAVEDLPFFVGLMEHLAGKGLSCPQPVRAQNGDILGTVAGRTAAVFTFLEGVWPREPTVDHCAKVGAALAELHRDAEGFQLTRANALAVDDWRPLLRSCGPDADRFRPGLLAECEEEIAFLEAHWPRHLPKGVVHADLFPDNVFFLNEEVSGIIDFYFACNDLLAYDLAIALTAWCFTPKFSFDADKGGAMIAGYADRRRLSAAEMEVLPILSRGASMRFLLTRLYDWLTVPEGSLVTKKDPMEYLAKLRFHRTVRDIGDYGFEGHSR